MAKTVQQRMAHIQEILRNERGELSALDHEVAESVAAYGMLASNLEDDFAEKRTLWAIC